jgi:hypothetical protein
MGVSHKLFAWAGLKSQSSTLCLLSTYNYRHEPLSLALMFSFFLSLITRGDLTEDNMETENAAAAAAAAFTASSQLKEAVLGRKPY